MQEDEKGLGGASSAGTQLRLALEVAGVPGTGGASCRGDVAAAQVCLVIIHGVCVCVCTCVCLRVKGSF